MNIALVIVHNKIDSENFNQIEAVKPLIEKHVEIIDELDENDVKIGQGKRVWYTLKGLALPHFLKVYQIIPYQPSNISDPYKAILPSNFYEIDAHNVQYGKGDEDKTGDHPRFWNWGLKRSTDYGSEATIYLEDYKKFSVDDLAFQLNTLIDPTDKTEYIEDQSIKIGTVKLLKEVGQLDETKTKEDAITDLKDRVIEKGLENG